MSFENENLNDTLNQGRIKMEEGKYKVYRRLCKRHNNIASQIAHTNFEIAFGLPRHLEKLKIEQEWLSKTLTAMRGEKIISDHAIARYYLRKKGVSHKTLEDKIMTKTISKKWAESGYKDGDYWCKSHGVAIKQGIVMTVMVLNRNKKPKP